MEWLKDQMMIATEKKNNLLHSDSKGRGPTVPWGPHRVVQEAEGRWTRACIVGFCETEQVRWRKQTWNGLV